MNRVIAFSRRAPWSDCSWLASIILLGLLVGCASVNPDPFVKYHSAVREAQTGVDSATSLNYDWTRSGFIEEFSNNPNSKFSQLIVQTDENYNWTLIPYPAYLTVKQMQDSLTQLNGAFVNYADLLIQLANDRLISTTDFDLLAHDLNQNAREAAKALKVTLPPEGIEGIAIFSTAASEAARLYIEHGRQTYLMDALKKNQSNIEEYSRLCIIVLKAARAQARASYVDRMKTIETKWNTTIGEQRQKKTEAILVLNEQYVDTLQIFKELATIFGTLPTAHSDLWKSIENPKFNIESIQKLFASAKRLQNLSNQLKQAPEK